VRRKQERARFLRQCVTVDSVEMYTSQVVINIMNKTISRRQKILRDSLVSHGKKRNKLILRAGSPEISNYGKASGETADTHAFHETDGYFV